MTLQALFDALDAERQRRELSWAQVTRELSGRYDGLSLRQGATSTLTGLPKRRVAEGDGVLQMLLWLHRTPESFDAEYTGPTTAEHEWPNPPRDRILRFDTRGIYAALDAQRTLRGLTWAAVARELSIGPAPTITRLREGGRTAFPHVEVIARWLGRPVLSLTHLAQW